MPSPRATPALNNNQRRYLRGLGHHLEPVVLAGKEGVTGGLIEATRAALEHHELIKVRLAEAAGDRRAVAAEIAAQAAAALVQVIGRIAVLYRARAEDPSIKLPA